MTRFRGPKSHINFDNLSRLRPQTEVAHNDSNIGAMFYRTPFNALSIVRICRVTRHLVSRRQVKNQIWDQQPGDLTHTACRC